MEKDFCAEWLNQMLHGMEHSCSIECIQKNELFENCASLHYQTNQMDNILEKYIGKLSEFITFLEHEWGWKITADSKQQKLLVDENKNFCCCPISAKLDGNVSPLLCNCSEHFAKMMFSKVCQKEVQTRVVRSFLRDKKSCIYEISL